MRQHPLVPGIRVWATNRVDSVYVLAVELGKWIPGCLGQPGEYVQSGSIVTELLIRDLYEITDAYVSIGHQFMGQCEDFIVE